MRAGVCAIAIASGLVVAALFSSSEAALPPPPTSTDQEFECKIEASREVPLVNLAPLGRLSDRRPGNNQFQASVGVNALPGCSAQTFQRHLFLRFYRDFIDPPPGAPTKRGRVMKKYVKRTDAAPKVDLGTLGAEAFNTTITLQSTQLRCKGLPRGHGRAKLSLYLFIQSTVNGMEAGNLQVGSKRSVSVCRRGR